MLHLGQGDGKLIPVCPPVRVTAILYGGPFAASLRLLLQKDSVMEIGSQGAIYAALLKLLALLGTFTSIVISTCTVGKAQNVCGLSPM